MTQEEDKQPTPSGRTRDDFRRKKPEDSQREKNTEETETKSAIPNNNDRLTQPVTIGQVVNRIVRDIIDRKEFWIFFSGLMLGYIVGRFI